jgi:hypothetical protein
MMQAIQTNCMQRGTISVQYRNWRRAHRSFDLGLQEASPWQFDFAGLFKDLDIDLRRP